ncbi:glycoside hydrolase family 16 protein, partial [Agrocybe pediades]
MVFSACLATFLVLGLVPSSLGAQYLLKENIIGSGFYDHFDWEAVDDPSHGRVTYVDMQTSIDQNLTYGHHNTFILRTDFQSVLQPDGPGRNSVRIRSKNTYTTHVAIFEMRHMPQGCGTWPAIRETKESDKPAGGLVDILEGVNDQAPDTVTLHTIEGCTMPVNRSQTGITRQLDCNVAVNSNAGCGVSLTEPANYGPDFNANGGGWYAIERAADHISIWFWPRSDRHVPHQVKSGGVLVNPKEWGTPSAFFPNTSCDMTKFFEEHNIIINLTLCGDWAGSAYSSTDCPSTCIDHVNNDPAAFKDAYFDFAAVRVYEPLVSD